MIRTRTMADGHANNQHGQSTCKPCSPGTYAHTHGSTECSSCRAGNYQPEEGQVACLECVSGTVSHFHSTILCRPALITSTTYQVNGERTSCDVVKSCSWFETAVGMNCSVADGGGVVQLHVIIGPVVAVAFVILMVTVIVIVVRRTKNNYSTLPVYSSTTTKEVN